MFTIQELSEGRTLAEAQGMTAEIGRAIARIAEEEIRSNGLETAREILEGLAIANPYDPAPWALLTQVERRRGKQGSARLCAEIAHRLAPADPQVRLIRAETLLYLPDGRPAAERELRELTGAPGNVGIRAKALLSAMGVTDQS